MDVLQSLLSECQIIHRTTTAYHPQMNGLTERLNRTLGDMLSMHVASDHSNWDAVLPFVTYAYNTASQATTGFSPFFLLYGRQPSSTIDTVLPYRPDPADCSPVATVAQHAEKCRQLARSLTSAQQCRQKQRHDLKPPPHPFAIDSLVWLWVPPIAAPGRSSKLLPKYHGPYRVIAQTSPVNYVVEPVLPSSDLSRRG